MTEPAANSAKVFGSLGEAEPIPFPLCELLRIVRTRARAWPSMKTASCRRRACSLASSNILQKKTKPASHRPHGNEAVTDLYRHYDTPLSDKIARGRKDPFRARLRDGQLTGWGPNMRNRNSVNTEVKKDFRHAHVLPRPLTDCSLAT
jgi:hypothetical protein